MTIQHITVSASQFFQSHPGLFLAASKNPYHPKGVKIHARGRDLVVKTHDTEYRVRGGREAVRKELEAIAAPVINEIRARCGEMTAFDRLYNSLLIGEWICLRGMPTIRERDAGPLVVTQGGGTYFGSGSFSANWLGSEGCTMEGSVSKDNGFARYVETELILTKGDWTLDYMWAEPGSKRNILWICC